MTTEINNILNFKMDLKPFRDKIFYRDNVGVTATTQKTINNKIEFLGQDFLNLNQEYLKLDLDLTFFIEMIKQHINYFVIFKATENNLQLIITDEKQNIIKEKDFNLNTNNSTTIKNYIFMSSKFNLEYLNNLIEIFNLKDNFNVYLSHNHPLIITDNKNKMGVISPIISK